MIASDSRCRNGIRVIVLDRPGSSAVEIAAVVRAGWRHDPPGAVGTAHLTEHLLTVGADDVSRGIESAGGSFEATTHPDHMQFVTVAPASLWRALAVAEVHRAHGRMMLRSSDVDIQRDAVAQEIRAAAGSPSPWPAMTSALYGGDHALGHEGFGELADLDRIDLAACTRFAGAVVRPERTVLVVALDVSEAGGANRILDVVDAVRATPAAPGGLVRDEYPRDTYPSDTYPSAVQSRPRTASDGGVTETWCGWTVPGLTRSPGDHLRWFAASAVVERRCTAHRFGRSGPGYVGDRDTLAAAGPSESAVVSALDAPVTAAEFEHAHRRVRRAAVDFRHDAASIARLTTFTGAPTVPIPELRRSDLDGVLARLRSTRPAVVTPDPERRVDHAARPSSAQTPRSTRRRPVLFVHNRIESTDRRVRVRGLHAAAIETDGPTHVCVRTPAPFRSPLWEAVTDFSGHRYAARIESPDQVTEVLMHLPNPVSEIAAVGARAGVVLQCRTEVHHDSPVSLEDGAARWLALGALNSVHRIAVGDAPTVRVLRLPTRPHPTVRVVGDGDRDLRSLVDGWTAEELRHTRTFCAGQALSATASGAATADLLLTLLCNDIRVAGDPLGRFASALLDASETDIRQAAYEVLEAADRMTNVMSAG